MSILYCNNINALWLHVEVRMTVLQNIIILMKAAMTHIKMLHAISANGHRHRNSLINYSCTGA